MVNISKKNKELYNLGKGDNLIQFDLSNPTTSDVTYDLFNTTTLSLVPTVANPVVAPSVVSANVPVGTAPEGIAFNPISNTMYVCNNATNDISVIDCNTNSVIFTILIASAPQAISYCSANNTMYIGTNIGSVIVIDCDANTVIATILNGGVGLAYNPINNSMYGCSSIFGYISVINCNTNTFTTIAVVLNPINISYNSLSNTMYYTSTLAVVIIDCNTNTIIGSPIIIGSYFITYNSLNNSMYISNTPLLSISVIDCNTNTVILTIPTTGAIVALTYLPLTNNIYFCNFTVNSIDVIDCNTNTVINTIPIGGFPFDIAYNFLSNTVYNTNVGGSTVSVISPLIPQVSYIGGSFDYNAFIQDVINNPVGVDRMVIVSQNNGNFNQVLNVVYKDANGIETQNPFIPSLSVGISQFQSGIGKVDFPNSELVLGVNQYLSNFLVKANSEVKVLLIYKQLEKSKLLSDKKGMFGRLEIKCNPIQTLKPNSDAPFDYFPIIPIIPTKPSIRPFSIRDIVPDVKINVNPDIRTNVKPDVKINVKPDIRTDVKPDVKTNVRTDVKPDVKVEIKPFRN